MDRESLKPVSVAYNIISISDLEHACAGEGLELHEHTRREAALVWVHLAGFVSHYLGAQLQAGNSCKRSPRRQVEGAQLHKHKRPEVAAALARVLIETGRLPAHAAGPTMHLAWLNLPGGSDWQSCGSACSQSA